MTAPHPIKSITESLFFKKFKTAIFSAFFTAALCTLFAAYLHYKDTSTLTTYSAGKYSVSINEKHEITIIDRTWGRPVILDSTLTTTIYYQLAGIKYAQLNQPIR